jgi:hypothetical protein
MSNVARTAQPMAQDYLPTWRVTFGVVVSVVAVPRCWAECDPSIGLCLSWTHWIELLQLDDLWKRAFYENECLNGTWSVRQLKRQIGSLLYERTGLSKDKRTVIGIARKQATEAPAQIADLIRDPYVLEFDSSYRVIW